MILTITEITVCSSVSLSRLQKSNMFESLFYHFNCAILQVGSRRIDTPPCYIEDMIVSSEWHDLTGLGSHGHMQADLGNRFELWAGRSRPTDKQPHTNLERPP